MRSESTRRLYLYKCVFWFLALSRLTCNTDVCGLCLVDYAYHTRIMTITYALRWYVASPLAHSFPTLTGSSSLQHGDVPVPMPMFNRRQAEEWREFLT